jgi:hypothetical protein
MPSPLDISCRWGKKISMNINNLKGTNNMNFYLKVLERSNRLFRYRNRWFFLFKLPVWVNVNKKMFASFHETHITCSLKNIKSQVKKLLIWEKNFLPVFQCITKKFPSVSFRNSLAYLKVKYAAP